VILLLNVANLWKSRNGMHQTPTSLEVFQRQKYRKLLKTNITKTSHLPNISFAVKLGLTEIGQTNYFVHFFDFSKISTF